MEDILPDLGNASRNIRTLQEQIDFDYQKLDKIKQRKSEILQRLEEIRDSSIKNKALRDEKNKLIAEKKKLRDQLHSEKAEESEKINELLAKKKALLSSVDYHEDELLAQLKEISWRYQTTTLTKDEDRRAVQKISELEKRLVYFKKVKEVDQEINRHRARFDELRAAANATHNEVISLAEESKNYHESLIKGYEERSALVDELDEGRKTMQGLRDEIAKAKDELFVANAQFRVARNHEAHQKAEYYAEQAKLKANRLAEQEKLLLNKKTELAEKANVKLKNGGRLTFEEFAAVVETSGVPGSDTI
jgi:uncharacterized coiled-coil DUF342 family protein